MQLRVRRCVNPIGMEQDALNEPCFWFLCFTKVAASEPKFFGFSEFLAGLALMVLAWTIADLSYKFRIETAPIPLRKITFYMVSVVGFLTLLTDLWRAEEWLVPRGHLFTPSTWQASLGVLFLSTFLLWAWYAFIRPPIFDRRSAKNFVRAVYKAVFKGSYAELVVVADELIRSSDGIVNYSIIKNSSRVHEVDPSKRERDKPDVAIYANELLLLLSEKKLCKAIVDASPATAIRVFMAVKKQNKYPPALRVFSKNVLNQALVSRESFMYHETGGYNSGLIAHHKPLSHAMFSSHSMVERIGSMFELDLWGEFDFGPPQWEAYCRVVLITYRDKVTCNFWGESNSLDNAFDNIKTAVNKLYKLSAPEFSLETDSIKNLKLVLGFIKSAIGILEEVGVPEFLPVRKRGRFDTHYDQLSKLLFEVLQCAGGIRSPSSLTWWVQYNLVWGEIFGPLSTEGAASKVVGHKLRRLIYDEIQCMRQFPNFKGAKCISFLISVVGFLPIKSNTRHETIVRRMVVDWFKGAYVELYCRNPKVAAQCLSGDLEFDEIRSRVIKTYAPNALRPKPRKVYLQL